MKKSTKALRCYKTNTHPSLQREHMGCGRRSAGMCLKGSIMAGRGGGFSYRITWRWAVTKCAIAEGMATKLLCGRRNSNSIWLTSNCISTQSGSSWGSCALKGVNLCSRGEAATVSWLNRTAGVYRAQNTTGQIFNSSSRKTDGASNYSWPCIRRTNPGAGLHEPQTTADDLPQKWPNFLNISLPKHTFFQQPLAQRSLMHIMLTLHTVTIVHALCWWHHSLAHHQPNYTPFLLWLG